jgi:transposase-like protein
MSERELRVSQKDVHRIHVIRLTIEGRETVGTAARLLGISPRQVKRLRRKMKQRGCRVPSDSEHGISESKMAM